MDASEVLIEPLSLRITDATRISGLSQSELYRRAGNGELQFRKAGTTTLVDYESLKRLVKSLPLAVITTRT
jgi:hypothetical protein